jgi:hypothetical protein
LRRLDVLQHLMHGQRRAQLPADPPWTQVRVSSRPGGRLVGGTEFLG